MAIHVFHYSGIESRTILVKATSEIEARRKVQKQSI